MRTIHPLIVETIRDGKTPDADAIEQLADHIAREVEHIAPAAHHVARTALAGSRPIERPVMHWGGEAE
ncbi:hypothetical protein [Sphingomonas sp.]